MARKRHAPVQILAKLRAAEVMQFEGRTTAEIAKRLELSERTFHRSVTS